MAELGYVSLVAGLVLAVFGIVTSVIGARRRHPGLIASGRNAVYAVAGLIAMAAVSLWYSLIKPDFSVEYVVAHSERALPLFYKISGLWSGQDGSILFWTLILSVFSVATLFAYRGKHRRLMPYVSATLLTVSTFFLIVLLFAANPFNRLPVTLPDGQGMNPLLQNYWMVIHPIGLYLGMVGFTVPFAFAVAALITGDLGNTWVRLVRRWTLISWLFLGFGIVAGSIWAYVELGWGGYWAWDAVENASFLPWLTGTAFLHTIVIQEKRGMLKVWSMVLIFITFTLTLVGTFITRSGVIQSVHSFAISPIGPLFLGFIAIVMLGFLYLLFDRLPLLRSKSELDSMRSREFAFLLNNLTFLGIAFATMLGTFYPMITELFGGTKIAVSEPFFQKVNGPIFLLLLVLMGVGPLLGWRRSSGQSLVRNFRFPLAFALIFAVGIYLLGVRAISPWLGMTASGLVLFTIVQEFYRGTRARRQATKENWLAAFSHLIQRNRRRYGGYIVHLGIVVMAFGIIGATFFQSEGQANLQIGESLQINDYSLEYQGLRMVDRDTRTIIAATLDVYDDGRPIGSVEPHRNLYHKNPDEPTNEVGLMIRPLEDLYVVLAGWEDGGASASFKVYVNPLMLWVWMGGLILALGTLVAMWPQQMLARRRVTATLPQGTQLNAAGQQ